MTTYDARPFLYIWRREKVSHLHRAIQPIKAHPPLSQGRKLYLSNEQNSEHWLLAGVGAELHSHLHKICTKLWWGKFLTTHIALIPGAKAFVKKNMGIKSFHCARRKLFFIPKPQYHNFPIPSLFGEASSVYSFLQCGWGPYHVPNTAPGMGYIE